jgi:hypothetical protein
VKYAILLALCAAPLAAQSSGGILCSSDVPNPRVARAEGRTELVGDVVVTCSGGSPTGSGQFILAANFTLTFDSAVTSKIVGPGNASEALLFIDDPDPTTQVVCAAPPCTNVAFGAGNSNVFQGIVGTGAAANTITWLNVPLDPPGDGFRTLRFTNVRLDATAAKSGALHVGVITVTGYAGLNSIGGQLTVATVQSGLTTSVRDASSANAAPAGVPVTLTQAGSTTPTRTATLRFSMGYAGADLPRTDAPFISADVSPPPADQNFPGSTYNSESGFYNSKFPSNAAVGNLSIAGLANWGTRLMATFNNIPAGVTVYVTLQNDAPAFINAQVARLIATDAAGAGAFTPITGNGTLAALTPAGGTASAVWEVLRNFDGVAPDDYNFGVYLSYNGNIYPAPPTMTVTMRLAPLSGGIPNFSGAGATLPLATFTALTPPPPPTPTLGVSPGSFTFNATAGGKNPAAQSLFVSSTPNALGYGISGGGAVGLRAQLGTGITPDTASISVNTQGVAPGTYRDTFTVSGGGASIQVPVTLTVAPGPIVISISPASALAGAPAFTLSVSGANFTPGTVVTWNGASLGTTFVSAGSLTAQVPAALVATAGSAAVGVLTLDGAKSNSLAFTILPFSLSAISPTTVAAGGPAFTLTATGIGFQTGATLNVGGAAAQITAAGATSITATVPASAIAQAGSLPVTVSNPGGLVSNALTLTVVTPLTLTSISPSTVTATHPDFTMTLTGTGFTTGVTAQLGTTTLTGTLGTGSMTVTVPAAVVAQPGSIPVRVLNANGIGSNTLTLTVNPAPQITALSPSSIAAGSAAFTLTVSGTGLSAGSTVQWNGQGLSTTGSGPLAAQVGASLIATAGTASITVVTADGVTSNSLPFTIGPAATITALSPSTANVGSGAFTLTVTGQNLAQGSTVNWNGQGLSTTFVSSTTLTAQVPATLLAAASTANVTVTNATGSLPFKIVLPPLTNVNFGAPPTAPSGQDQPVTITLGATYPVDLKLTVTLTFAPDSGLPDDPAIQFQNGGRTFTVTIPAGTPAAIPALIAKTGTVAGVITISATFTTTTGTDVTPPTVAPQRIQVGRAVPTISLLTCTRSTGGFTVVIDGFTNTREATQATFDFTAASGQSLGTSELQVSTTSLFSGWFGSSAGSTIGGIFRYTQPFTVSGSSTVAGVTVKLGNSAGTSATASCQLP